MMDPRHASQFNSNGGNGPNGASNYQYNGTQNDPFNSFINTDDENAFDNSWQAPEYNAHQASNAGFDHGNQPWQQPPYQTSDSSFLPISQYSVDARFSPSDSAYQYPSFNSNPTHDLASREISRSPYPAAAGFGTNSISNGAPFQYSGPPELEQASQTISPAAIESYSTYQQPSFDPSRNVSAPWTSHTLDDCCNNTNEMSQTSQQSLKYSVPGDSSTSQVGISSAAATLPLSIQDWRQLAVRTVKSIDKPGLRIKPTNQFENVTQSKRFNGFIFVGNNSVVANSSKGRMPCDCLVFP